MKTRFASLLLLLAACGGSSKSSTTTQSSADTRVDPTLPSWLPPSCIAYHKAVAQAIDCEAVVQEKRDRIKADFEDASVGWKAEQNASAVRVDEVGATCTTSTESVRADIGDSCV